MNNLTHMHNCWQDPPLPPPSVSHTLRVGSKGPVPLTLSGGRRSWMYWDIERKSSSCKYSAPCDVPVSKKEVAFGGRAGGSMLPFGGRATDLLTNFTSKLLSICATPCVCGRRDSLSAASQTHRPFRQVLHWRRTSPQDGDIALRDAQNPCICPEEPIV